MKFLYYFYVPCHISTTTRTTKYHLCCELKDVIPANANSKLKWARERNFKVHVCEENIRHKSSIYSNICQSLYIYSVCVPVCEWVWYVHTRFDLRNFNCLMVLSTVKSLCWCHIVCNYNVCTRIVLSASLCCRLCFSCRATTGNSRHHTEFEYEILFFYEFCSCCSTFYCKIKNLPGKFMRYMFLLNNRNSQCNNYLNWFLINQATCTLCLNLIEHVFIWKKSFCNLFFCNEFSLFLRLFFNSWSSPRLAVSSLAFLMCQILSDIHGPLNGRLKITQH